VAHEARPVVPLIISNLDLSKTLDGLFSDEHSKSEDCITAKFDTYLAKELYVIAYQQIS
jgi:hypothetical protein